MPTNVPLNDDGFEDPAAFMNSPTASSVTNSASRRTTLGAPSSAGTSRRTTKGRMSQLDGSDDDDDLGPGLDATLEEDDYDGESLLGGSKVMLTIQLPTRLSLVYQVCDRDSRSWVPRADILEPTTVPLPRRSELAPATPGTNVDDLPSPSASISRSISKSASKRKSTLGGSPGQNVSRRSIATTINRSPLTSRSIDFEDESMLLEDNDEDDLDPTVSPNSRRQSRRDTMATDHEGDMSVDAARHRNDRKSMASRKSYAEDQSIGMIGVDEDDDEDMDQNHAFDNGGGEDEDEDDLQADEEQAEAEIALDDDEPAVNEDDVSEVDQDEDTGEETAVERPPPKAKKAKVVKPAKQKTIRRSRQRSDSSSSSSTSPIKRARVSGFPLVPGE
jgi:hypothetical protein